MFDSFSHYVSYGATDQETIRELSAAIDGLVVPGTVAAFQKEGTGGFVLTLSATAKSPNYVIDPRFPLFQQPLRSPKASHLALARLVGASQLVSNSEPDPDAFSPELVEQIAANWITFNLGYPTEVSAKFEKYAKRLNQPVVLPEAKPPLYVLAPYLVAAGTGDPWWDVSSRLFEATSHGTDKAVRVVAVTDTRALRPLLESVADKRLVAWVSGLDETEADPRALAAYGLAVAAATKRAQQIFALYGGFFSVLLASQGLRGSSHGIGFGESRHWIELPQSGPPPARYYIPLLHRYVRREFAYQLWLVNPSLAECNCPECVGVPPVALEYHSLMKHSVFCRAREIDEWTSLDAEAMAARLERDFDFFLDVLDNSGVQSVVRAQAERLSAHLPRWALALRLMSE